MNRNFPFCIAMFIVATCSGPIVIYGSVALISWHTNNTNIDIKDPQDPLKHLYDIDDGEESSGGLEVI